MDSDGSRPEDARFVSETGLAARLAGLVEPSIVGLGYRLVRVTVTGRDGQTVQIMAERPDGTMMIEDCETISRNLSPLLDANDMLEREYVLEVSSPGIDRPLTRRRDFQDYSGHEAKLDLKFPLEGRKRVKGVLKGLRGEDVIIETELGPDRVRGELVIPYASIGEAKLLLTDALIELDLKRRKQAEKSAQPR